MSISRNQVAHVARLAEWEEPMSISRDQVAHVARLANLELSEKDIERMVQDLNKVLGYVACLERVGCGGS